MALFVRWMQLYDYVTLHKNEFLSPFVVGRETLSQREPWRKTTKTWNLHQNFSLLNSVTEMANFSLKLLLWNFTKHVACKLLAYLAFDTSEYQSPWRALAISKFSAHPAEPCPIETWTFTLLAGRASRITLSESNCNANWLPLKHLKLIELRSIEKAAPDRGLKALLHWDVLARGSPKLNDGWMQMRQFFHYFFVIYCSIMSASLYRPSWFFM